MRIPDKNGVHPRVKRPHKATGNPRMRSRVHPTNKEKGLIEKVYGQSALARTTQAQSTW